MSAEEKDGAGLQQEEVDSSNASEPEEDGLRIWPVVRRKNPYVPKCQSWKGEVQLAVDASDPDRLIEALRTATKEEINKQCPVYRTTALHMSVTSTLGHSRFGRREPARAACCKALIDAGADLNIREQFGSTPLSLAAQSNAPQDIPIRMLVEARADLLVTDSAPQRSAHEPAPARQPQPRRMRADAVSARGADWGCTPLHQAAMNAKPDELRVLLTHPDAQAARAVVDDEGHTPLGRAEALLNQEEYSYQPVFMRTHRLLVDADDASKAGADDSAGGMMRTIGDNEENKYGVPGPLPQKIPDLIKGPVKQPKDSMMGTLLPGLELPKRAPPSEASDIIDRYMVERVIEEQNATRGPGGSKPTLSEAEDYARAKPSGVPDPNKTPAPSG